MRKEEGKKSKKWIWLIAGLALLLIVVGVLLAVLLPGQQGGDTASWDGKLYWNVDRAFYTENAEVEGLSMREKGDDGLYHVILAVDGQQVEYTCADKQLINYMDTMDLFAVTLDESGMLVDVIEPTAVATEVANGFFVQNVAEDAITVNSSQAINGMEQVLAITENTGIYDVTSTAEMVGQIAVPEIMDQVLVYGNADGEVTHIYIIQHPVDAEVYWRVERCYDTETQLTTRVPDEDGVYTIQCSYKGELVDLKCRDKTIVNNVDSKAILMGQNAFVFDEEGYIVDTVDIALSLRGKYLASDYHVTAIEGDTYTLTKISSGNQQGDVKTVTLAENCEIFNCCQWGCYETCGEYTDQLKLYDRVNLYSNLDGEAVLIFVTRRMVGGDVKLYYNYDRQYGGDAAGTMRKQQNGYYVFQMLLDGELKTVRVKDKEMADAIDKPYNRTVGLELDGDIVTKVHNPSCVIGGPNYANEIPVTSMSGPMVTFTYTNGTTRNFMMSADCKVYNAITGEYGKSIGGEMELQVGDTVIAFTDYKDELAVVWVVSRPISGAKIYYNLSRLYNSETKQTTRTPDAEGYYVFLMACEGKQVTVKTKDKGMATFIDSQSAPLAGLKVNSQGIITNAYAVTAVLDNATKTCNYHYVKDLNTKEKTFGTYYIIDDVRTDSAVVQKIADDCIVYNVSTSFENFRGEKSTLKNGDQIQAIKSLETGEIIMIFIMRRDPTYGYESYKAHCSHCNQTVTWQPYGGTVAKADTHYYACGNVTVTQSNVGAKDDGEIYDVVIDLKGCSITSSSRMFLVYDKLTVLDSVGGGSVAGTTPAGGTPTIGSTIMVMEGGELNLQSGSLTLSDKSTAFGSLGGVVYVQPGATMNMSGGAVSGGTSDSGGNVYIGGTFNMSGGTISGGTAPVGSNISVASTGTLNISGGTVDGGIYMGKGIVTLSGKPVITGTGLQIPAGGKISVAGLTSGASVVIDGDGVFTEALENAQSYAAYFKPVAEGDSITVDGNTLSYYKLPADYNSVDNSNLSFTAGTTNAYCPACEKTVTWTALTADSALTFQNGDHYYLASDLTFAGSKDIWFLTAPGTGKTACLHLNGHNVSCTNNRVIQGSTGTLNIMGNGTVCGGWKTGNYVLGGTVGINTSGASGKLNLIGGTYVTADANTPVVAITDNGGTINMYAGATIRANAGSTAVHIGKATLVNAKFNMYGGTVADGAINMSGADNDLGNTASLYLGGGTVSGGVNISANSDVTVEGNLVVSGLNIPKGVLIEVGTLTQGADITVTANGVFTVALENVEAAKQYFSAVDEEAEIEVKDNALSYKGKVLAGGLELDENGYALCEHCGESVQWTEITGGLGTITDTTKHHHYYLTGNLTLSSGALMSVNGKADVCLHLNNYTVTQNGWINVISGTLSVMDGTAGTGGLIGTSTKYNTVNVSWGTLNIYGGTFQYAGSAELSTIQMGQTSSKLNAYGGKVVGGLDVNYGTLTLSKNATVTGASGELTDNIYVAAAGKLVVKSDYVGAASVTFESLTDNTIPAANGASEGAFEGKLYLEAENTPEIIGEGTKLVIVGADDGGDDDDSGEEEQPTGGLELDENGYAQCEHCGESVQWTALTGVLGTNYTDGGHYYLASDINTDSQFATITGGAAVCLHLNGKNLTVKSRIYVGQATLSIMGDGTFTTTGTTSSNEAGLVAKWGNTTLNLYGGTYTTTNTNGMPVVKAAGGSTAVINIHDGVVIQGTDTNLGVLVEKGELSLSGNSAVDSISVTKNGKLVVKADWTGTANASFETISYNAIPVENGVSEGDYTGKLYLATEEKPAIVAGTSGNLVIAGTVDGASAFSSVVLTVGADETQRNITFYTTADASNAVQLAYADAMTGSTFPEAYITVGADVTSATGRNGYYINKATLSGLKENTDYIYRFKAGEEYSDIYTFRVGTFEDDFQFAFVGDPQFGDATYSAQWSDTLQKIDSSFDAEIIVSAGDQINKATSEEQYDYFLVDELTSMAFAATVGPNHDDPSASFGEHFNLPNLSTSYGVDTTSADYWYVYNNVLFMHLNMADDDALETEHKAFMEEAIAANPDADWKIVVLHTALFSTGYHSDPDYTWYETEIAKFRQVLAPQLSELDIDVVLSGHDHVYVRSQLMNGTEVSGDVVTNNSVVAPEGTLHICANSSTGSKFYDCYVEDAEYVAAENYEKRKSAIIFSVTDNELTLKSYFLDGDTPVVFDTFSIYKEAVEDDGADENTGDLKLDDNGYGYCEACDATVQWTLATSAPGTVTDTTVHHHYYLGANFNLTSGSFMLVNSGAKVCLHLNGHTLTQNGWINVISGTLNIMDNSAGNGRIVGTSTQYNTLNVSWGTLNIYGGTIEYLTTGTTSAITMIKSSAKLNMLGGAVINGIAVDMGAMTLGGDAAVSLINVASDGKLTVKADYTGTSCVVFESALVDNVVPAANGVSEGEFAGKLYHQQAGSSEFVADGTSLVLKGSGIELDENGYAQCEHCGESVQWTALTGVLGTNYTDGGHYYLASNMTTDYQFATITGGATVCLHLNGKTLTVKSRIYVQGSTLNIMGGGTYVTTGTTSSNEAGLIAKWGSSVINLYGGTYTTTNTNGMPVVKAAGSATATVNVYDGVVIEGDSDNAAIKVDNGVLNLHGGAVYGGVELAKGSVNLSGGATVTGANGELTGNIGVASGAKLNVYNDWSGVASVQWPTSYEKDAVISTAEGQCGSLVDGAFTAGGTYAGSLTDEATGRYISGSDGTLVVGETKQEIEDKTLKILGIGNSFTWDSMYLLYDVYKAENLDKDIELAFLHYAGGSLSTHVTNLTYDRAVYSYYKINSETYAESGKWKLTEDATMLQALQDECWDIVTMQQSSANSPNADTYNEDIGTVRTYVVNTLGYTPEFVWNFTWAYPDDEELLSTNSDANFASSFFTNYGTSAGMYAKISAAVQEKIVNGSYSFDYLMPVGTAIQNARNELTAKELYRDSLHLNDLGRLIAAYTWYGELEGYNGSDKALTDLKLTTVPAKLVVSNGVTELDAELEQIVLDAVNNALRSKFEVTES